MKLLRREMKLKGISVEKLSTLLDVSQTTIYIWLKGKYIPKTEFVKALKDLGFSDEASINPAKDVEV